MSCNCVLNRYIFVLILCVLTEGSKNSGNKEMIAPGTVYYEMKNVMRAKAIIKNIPKGKRYNYEVYNAERTFSTSVLMEGMSIEINEEFKTSKNDYIYYIKFNSEDGWDCEPVKILTALFKVDKKSTSKKCFNGKGCPISVDLNSTCQKENFALKLDVAPSKSKDVSNDVYPYKVGDKLKLLCSEQTRNKNILLQWHFSNSIFNDHVSWNPTDPRKIYDLYLEMDLKKIDKNMFVYCSATRSGKTLQTTNKLQLELTEELNTTDNLKTVYVNSDTNLVNLDCGNGYKQTKYVTNGTMLYCVEYIRSNVNMSGQNEYIIRRNTYNETIYYIYESEAQGITIGVIIGVCVTIMLIIIAIVSFLLYRRRQQKDIQSTVTYSTINEIVYAQLIMPESSSRRPRVELDASPYAEVIGVLAPKSEGIK